MNREALFETLCKRKGLRLTHARRAVATVLLNSKDHPDAEQIYTRTQKTANANQAKISLATVYRTLKILTEKGLLARHDFGKGKFRYEIIDNNVIDHHHDHLIDIDTGQVIEFQNEKIEELQKQVAKSLGYELLSHRLELIGRKKQRAEHS